MKKAVPVSEKQYQLRPLILSASKRPCAVLSSPEVSLFLHICPVTVSLPLNISQEQTSADQAGKLNAAEEAV
jgi:hypothetical protein